MYSTRYNYLIKKLFPLRFCCGGNYRHISVLIRKKKIYAVGFCSDKTHPLTLRFNYRWPTHHSELSAILNFQLPNKYLKDMTMVNIRFMKSNAVGLSKPCSACQSLLSSFGITSIYYTNGKGGFDQLCV